MVKTPDRNNSGGGKNYFGSWFHRFVSWSAGSKAETSWQKGMAKESLSAHGSWKAEKERKQEGPGTRETLPVHTLSDQLPPTFQKSIQLSMN